MPASLEGIEMVTLTHDTERLRTLILEVMLLSLRYWIQTTGKTKVALAEESRIWTAALDKHGTWTTRTLDRYLILDRIPKKPRWRNVLRTAYYTLQNCPDTASHLKFSLETKTTQLESLMSQSGR